MHRKLMKEELQELVLMTGGKKELRIYLGMTEPDFADFWKKANLFTPTEWVKWQEPEPLYRKVVELGSVQKAAKYYGVSTSFLRKILLIREPGVSLDQTRTELSPENLERYGSIALTARLTGVSPAEIRKYVTQHGLHHLLKYDFSSHNNAKGRRAEVWWADQEGDHIVEDCNQTQGSQAPTDYIHKVYGRVNVKSSRAHRYTARTRKEAPLYWKFSAKGLTESDYVAFVFYDEEMQEVVNVLVKPAPEYHNTNSIRFEQANLPNLKGIHE